MRVLLFGHAITFPKSRAQRFYRKEDAASAAVDTFFERLHSIRQELENAFPPLHDTVGTAHLRHQRQQRVLPALSSRLSEAMAFCLQELAISQDSVSAETVLAKLVDGVIQVAQHLDDSFNLSRAWDSLVQMLDLELFMRVCDHVQTCQDSYLSPQVIAVLKGRAPKLTAAAFFEDSLEAGPLSQCHVPMLGVGHCARSKLASLQTKLIKLSCSFFSAIQDPLHRKAGRAKAVAGVERWFQRLEQSLCGLALGGDVHNVLYFVRVFVELCSADSGFLAQLRNRYLCFKTMVETELVRLIRRSNQVSMSVLRADRSLRVLQIHSLGELECRSPTKFNNRRKQQQHNRQAGRDGRN